MTFLNRLFNRSHEERPTVKDSVRCPYCMETIKPNEILFMVEKGQGNPDEVFFEFADRFQGYDASSIAKNHTGTIIAQDEDELDIDVTYDDDNLFPVGLRWRRNGGEWHVATTRLCPHCHCCLPADIQTMDTKTIVLLGGTSCGKTTLIAGMLYMLVGNLNDADHEPLISNNLGTVNVEVDSLAFAKRMMNTSLLGAERDPTQISKPIFPIVLVVQNQLGEKRTLVTIHDFAGEGLNDPDYFVNHPISNAKCRTDGILYAIDCCQLPSLEGHFVAHSCTGNITGPLMVFSDMMKRTLKKADAVAITLTKFDLYTYFTAQNNASAGHAYNPLMDSHSRGVDIDTIKDVSNTVKNILDPVIQNQLNSVFGRKLHRTQELESIEYFATACLKPDGNDGMEAANEITASFDATCLHRVCEPLLYMFAKWGIFSVKS